MTDQAPVAADQPSLTTNHATPKSITLSATDADSDSLTYSVLDSPAHGSLSGTAPNLTYTPDVSYAGTDSFTFKASDGAEDSNTATVSISVTDLAPTASDQTSLTTTHLASLPITLSATDPEGDPLTYTVVTGPANGALGGTPPNMTYIPGGSFVGAETFTFKASDGAKDSNESTVSISVTDHAPTADDLPSVTCDHGVSIPITLPAADADGDALTYSIVDSPAHGTISDFKFSDGTLTYVPDP